MNFEKYHGLGNDFIVIDCRTRLVDISKQKCIALCDRHFGIGADGILLVLPGKNRCELEMKVINSDGSIPQMCGNGIRCVALFVCSKEEGCHFPRIYNILTGAGPLEVTVFENLTVRVNMGPPNLAPEMIPTILTTLNSLPIVNYSLCDYNLDFAVTCVNMGNPHAVIFADSLSTCNLAVVGPELENHAIFPERANIEFAEIRGDSNIKMIVWERGAGPTLACGTGACAVVVAAVLSHRIEIMPCYVELPGGILEISWRADAADNNVYMTGPATFVYSGLIPATNTDTRGDEPSIS